MTAKRERLRPVPEARIKTLVCLHHAAPGMNNEESIKMHLTIQMAEALTEKLAEFSKISVRPISINEGDGGFILQYQAMIDIIVPETPIHPWPPKRKTKR